MPERGAAIRNEPNCALKPPGEPSAPGGSCIWYPESKFGLRPTPPEGPDWGRGSPQAAIVQPRPHIIAPRARQGRAERAPTPPGALPNDTYTQLVGPRRTLVDRCSVPVRCTRRR